jgi:trehalose 2-sulfotransferase
MNAEAYIICATPRSGSTLLCDLLASSGVAGRPDSFYRRQSIADFARDFGVPATDGIEGVAFDRVYLDAVRREGKGDTAVFGLRLMWSSVAELSRRLDGLFPGLPSDAARLERAFGKPVYLHLSRDDKVAQAVSRLKAEQTGLWHVAADGSERERSAPPQPAVYDADRLQDFIDEVEHDEAAWEDWFSTQGIVPHRLTYNQLTADPRAALAAALSALGLEAAHAAEVDVRTSRMADADSMAWAARYRASSRNSGR